MKQIYAAALLVFAIVLASCAPEPPPYFTWCYSYDFYDSVDGINIINGDWVDGTGIVTNEDGLIQVNWVEDVEYVDLNQLVVWVQRGAPGSNTFRVSANGIIFGIAAAFDEQFPPYPAPSDFSGRFPVSSVPDPGSVFTNNANITIQADEPFILYSIEVRGIGPNPFGVNTCGDLTPTPEITLPPTVEPATPAATHTPTPTDTPDPATFTPSPTPTSTIITPTCQAQTQYSVWWNAPNPYPDPSTAPGNLTVTAGSFSAVDAGWFWRGVQGYPTGTFAAAEITWELPQLTHVSYIHTQAFACRNCGTFSQTARLKMWGDGVLLFDGLPGQLGLDNGTVGGNVLVPGWYRTIVVRAESWGATWAGAYVGRTLIGSTCSNGPTPTPTITSTPTVTLTPSVTNTPLLPTFTPTLTPLPSLTLGTPRPTSTPRPTTAPLIGPTYTYVLGTLPPNIPNVTPGTLSTSTPMMTITVTPEGTPGDGDGVFVPWGSYSGPDQTQSDIGSIGGALTNVASNLFGVGSRYLNEFTGMIDQIVVGWRTSTPTVIPGMPRCQSDRLRSELCAIYYIIQYTILGDPLGTIVLQVAIIVIDLFIGVTFILLARSILEQLRRILHI